MKLFPICLSITVSLGNSQACGALARKAFDMEANMVNHAFNSMTQLYYREGKFLGVFITNNQNYVW